MTSVPIISDVDSYKREMDVQYPPKVTHVHSYGEARGGPFPHSVFFGMQYILKNQFLNPVTQEDIELDEEIGQLHGAPSNSKMWKHIKDKHGGYLPLEIRALPEGGVYPLKTPLFTVVNTDERCRALTTHVETALLRVWYPTTVATLSRAAYDIIWAYLNRTSDAPVEEIGFKLHDFGSRGVSSQESAQIGGLAHLVNFRGTDTVAALVAGRKFYHEPMAGFSIPAAEHSTITSWGKAHEVDAYRNMIKQFGDRSIYAVVSDSYDIYFAVDALWGETLKRDVIEQNATLVVRPDSGHPPTVVLRVLHLLANRFGYSVNSKGFKVLKKTRVIQGDGINLNTIEEILRVITEEGFSTTNIAFGMGGALLQKVDRDTMSFAMKASAVKDDTGWRGFAKDPITDAGKKSKEGLLAVTKVANEYITLTNIDEATVQKAGNLLRPVYRNGKLLEDDSLATIRSRTNG